MSDSWRELEGWVTIPCIASRHYLCRGGQWCDRREWHMCHCECHLSPDERWWRVHRRSDISAAHEERSS